MVSTHQWMEENTHDLHWFVSSGDSHTTHAVILTDSMSLLQKVEWGAQTGMCQWSTSTLENSCGCAVPDMPG